MVLSGWGGEGVIKVYYYLLAHNMFRCSFSDPFLVRKQSVLVFLYCRPCTFLPAECSKKSFREKLVLSLLASMGRECTRLVRRGRYPEEGGLTPPVKKLCKMQKCT